jgi:hypothetical protein
MANSDKDILITPNRGQTAEPTIRFTGFNNTPTTLRVLDDGTVSFEGTAGQLFAVSDGLTGTIFSVNDISGIPSIEVLDDGTIKFAEYGGRIKVGTGSVLEAPVSTNAQTGTAYTLVLADAGKLIELNNSASISLTVPTNASVAFPIGTKIDILQTGAGQVTIGRAGVTKNASPGLKLSGQWAAASLVKRAENTWVLIGNLSA